MNVRTGLTIEQLHRICVEHEHLAEQLAVAAGRWSNEPSTVDFPQVSALLAAHSAQLSWHASLWRGRAPTIEEVENDLDLDVVGRLAEAVAGPETLRDRGALLYLVLGRWAEFHEALCASIDARVDGPTHRVLSLVSADLRQAADAGAELVGAGSDGAAEGLGALLDTVLSTDRFAPTPTP